MTGTRAQRPAHQASLVECGEYVLHVRVWPGAAEHTVIIWHGITGTSLDHVALAERLCLNGYRVVAPDSLRCGLSDWAADSTRHYGLNAIAIQARQMMDVLNIKTAAWIGVSKGGGLGIRLAADFTEGIAALILCDVGPTLPAEFRGVLLRRLGKPPAYPSLAAFRDHILRTLERERCAIDREAIDRLTASWERRMGPALIGYHYDPRLTDQLLHQPEDFDLWPQWQQVSRPILVLRGEHSKVFPEVQLKQMLAQNRYARSESLRGTGHLNFLEDPAHQELILGFLSTVHFRPAPPWTG